MSGYTPGPWRVERIFKKGRKKMLAIHPPHFYYDGEIGGKDEANAVLLAAAPDLLHALKLIRERASYKLDGSERETRDINRIATEAIASVEGVN